MFEGEKRQCVFGNRRIDGICVKGEEKGVKEKKLKKS